MRAVDLLAGTRFAGAAARDGVFFADVVDFADLADADETGLADVFADDDLADGSDGPLPAMSRSAGRSESGVAARPVSRTVRPRGV